MTTDHPDTATLVIETWPVRCDDPFLTVKPGASIRVTVTWEQKEKQGKGKKQGKSVQVKKRILPPGQYSLNAIIDDQAITRAFLAFEERGGMQKHFTIQRKPDRRFFLVSEIIMVPQFQTVI
jgi:hypothetical protein